MKWIPAIVLISMVVASATPIITAAQLKVGVKVEEQQIFDQLKKFSSYEELVNFVKASFDNYYNGYQWYGPGGGIREFSLASSGAAGVSFRMEDSGLPQANQLLSDFSITNAQISGVDEADIVKTDGNFIYVVAGRKIFILSASPTESRILSVIQTKSRPIEIFVVGDRLVVLGERAFGYLDEFDSQSPPVYPADAIITNYSTKTFIEIYDITNRQNPSLKRYTWLEGSYFDSRMVGNYVYVVVNTQVILQDNEIDLPELFSNGVVRTIQATEIYYFDNMVGWPCQFVTILSVNVQTEEESSKIFLMDSAQTMFVSTSNIYIVNYKWATDKTVVYKVAMSDGEVNYGCYGEVPGDVLNRFSMDEYQGYFRIATTTGNVWDGTAKNSIYVLDESLNLVGKLENIAPGERIYSARFMGARAYLVTFRQRDPFFVIDLSDPSNPELLGELQIPGYSDYLYPYDENHIIGIGRDTGVKIALFDVSDPQNPREVSKYEVGSRWTDSYALQNHKALLFSRAKNLLVMPIGDYWCQDAYVFHISVENGIVLEGTVTHQENMPYSEDDYYSVCSYWRYDSSRSVKRSLYIDNVLYTISDGLVKMNNLADLSEINEVELQ